MREPRTLESSSRFSNIDVSPQLQTAVASSPVSNEYHSPSWSTQNCGHSAHPTPGCQQLEVNARLRESLLFLPFFKDSLPLGLSRYTCGLSNLRVKSLDSFLFWLTCKINASKRANFCSVHFCLQRVCGVCGGVGRRSACALK